MVWFKLDDRFHSHPKLLALRVAHPRTWQRSVALWTIAASWCSEHERDGRVPDSMLGHFGATAKDAEALEECGLWAREEPEEWHFKGWEEYQPSSKSLREEREAGVRRARKSRESRKASANATERVRPASLTRPDPSRPVPERERESDARAVDHSDLKPRAAGLRWWSESFNSGGGAPPMFDRAYEVIGSKPPAERALVAEHVLASKYLRANKSLRNPDHIAKHWDRYVASPGDEPLKSVRNAEPSNPYPLLKIPGVAE